MLRARTRRGPAARASRAASSPGIERAILVRGGRRLAFLLLATAVAVAGCAAPSGAPPPRISRIPESPSPSTNPTSPEKVALGKQLFFDRRLSGPGNYSCETCHVRDK